GRAHAAEIAGDIGIEMECDEVGEVGFVQPFASQPLGAELIHESELEGWSFDVSIVRWFRTTSAGAFSS
ncbi:hypothetical protein ACP3V9_24890, partial [Salmonella enterica]|uniref:hypothetical protein n=1 Tax=Salmonella enterica TaxID=28901 RepID=UPI003CE83640